MGLPGITHSGLGAGAAAAGASSAASEIPATGGAGVGDTSVRVVEVASRAFTPEEKMELKDLTHELLRALEGRVSSHIGNRKYFNDKIIPDLKKLETVTSKFQWKRGVNEIKNWLETEYPGWMILPALKNLQDFIESHESSRGTKLKTSLTEDERNHIQDSLKSLNTALINEIKVIASLTGPVEPGRFDALVSLQKILPMYSSNLKTEGLDKAKIREFYKELETQKIILVDFADEIGSIQNKLIEH